MMTSLSQAWKMAQENIKISQKHQKTQYDKKTRDTNLKVGDQVMVLMPTEAQGERGSWLGPSMAPLGC